MMGPNTQRRRRYKFGGNVALACVVVIVTIALFGQWWAFSSILLISSSSLTNGNRGREGGSSVTNVDNNSIRGPTRALATEMGRSDGGQKGSGDNELTVFIGIKIGAGPRGVRFRAIQQTWLEDVLAEDGRARIKFFSRANQEEGGISDVLESEPALLDKGHGTSNSKITLRSLLVPTLCEEGQILCMTSAMFTYYLQHHANGTIPMASYFCNFDDDQYVNVPNLIKVLDSYSKHPKWHGKNLYIGNPPTMKKRKWEGLFIGGEQRIKFLTGGAGYCLSRDLVERGAKHFCSMSNYPDDVAVGHVVQHQLGIADPVVDVRFHSHLNHKYDPVREMPLEELSSQVSFGYNTKVTDDKALETFPNIPLLFPREEDPLHFRSLRCFLLKQSSGKDPPECASDT